MNFICRKAINLGGVKYQAGDTIPADAVHSGRVRALESTGYISKVSETEDDGKPAGVVQPVVPDEVTIEVQVKAENGEPMTIALKPDEVVAVFGAMQLNVDECAAAIGIETRENVLIILHSIDSRNGVKKAAKARAIEINAKPDTNAGTGSNGATDDSKKQPDNGDGAGAGQGGDGNTNPDESGNTDNKQ